jgi:hypothetical protein
MPRVTKKLLLPCVLLGALLASVSGCAPLLTQSAGAGAGVGGAAIANAVTSNGAITAGVGLGAQAAAIAGVQYLEKRVHGAEQDAIANAAGPVPVGGVAAWSISHEIPIENDQHGELTVVRDITPELPSGNGPAFDCKEIVFSVDTLAHKMPQKSFYTSTVCEDNARWKWATAEPATARWGALQ